MVGGTVIENTLTAQSETGHLVRRLWCVDRQRDECAVYADPEEAADVRPGDEIWWQCGKIMWTRRPYFEDRQIRKIGYSFTPGDDD